MGNNNNNNSNGTIASTMTNLIMDLPLPVRLDSLAVDLKVGTNHDDPSGGTVISNDAAAAAVTAVALACQQL